MRDRVSGVARKRIRVRIEGAAEVHSRHGYPKLAVLDRETPSDYLAGLAGHASALWIQCQDRTRINSRGQYPR